MQVEVYCEPRVTVIIPVFNAEKFLHRCLQSVLKQSLKPYEVIIVNDGSTDSSLRIISEYASKHQEIIILDQPNAGQGAARNSALARVRGEYVLFVDADDYIEEVTIQVAVDRIQQDNSDIVHFDWKLHDPRRPGGTHYYNADPFWHRRVLEGKECDELLRVQNYYSVCKLYRLSFLNKYSIRFEEGRIYEDNPFVLQVVNRAEKISLVHSPLYVVNPHEDSTTRSETKTDRHYRDHIYAIRRSFDLLDRRNPRGAAYLAAYHVKKLFSYYQTRIPLKYRKAYIREFLQIIHESNIQIPGNTSTNRMMRASIRLSVFEKKRINVFRLLILFKIYINPLVKKLKTYAKKVVAKSNPKDNHNLQIRHALSGEVRQASITFLGLDYAYAGNSKFLFEELISDYRFFNRDIKFITSDQRVSEDFRLEPGSLQASISIASSEFVIAESWIPTSAKKHRDSIWVQLWHGTPIKRMLFDSHEPRIIWNRRHHKTNKYRDIQQWDYLLADSQVAASLFQTAFLVDPCRVIIGGYPRVQYLRDKQNDKIITSLIRNRLGLKQAKIALYAPTWRDSNYLRNKSDFDYSYMLDVLSLSKLLGRDWAIVIHDHGYISSTSANIASENIYVASGEDIQDLILLSDIVISDYSSLIFDAIAISKPVILYAPDEESFEEHRGLYANLWEDLKPLRASTLDELYILFQNPDVEALLYLNKTYTGQTYRSIADSVLLNSNYETDHSDEAK